MVVYARLKKQLMFISAGGNSFVEEVVCLSRTYGTGCGQSCCCCCYSNVNIGAAAFQRQLLTFTTADMPD